MAVPVNADTLIAIKAYYEGTSRRFKLPLRDLGAYTFPQKIREVLSLSEQTDIVLERYSDSAAKWVLLDSENTPIYKQLYRAAKAKLKLRIKVTEHSPVENPEPEPESEPTPCTEETVPPACRGSYLNTVLNDPFPGLVENSSTAANRFNDPFADLEGRTMLGQVPLWPDQLEKQHIREDFAVKPTFYIDCNYCGISIPAVHWHCSICEDGDYDLCQECIDAGVSCPGVDHWLIKRTVADGAVVNSTTETMAPASRGQSVKNVWDVPEAKSAPEPQPEAEVEKETEESPLDTVEEEPQAEAEPEPEVLMRTCNACFNDYLEEHLVTCRDCRDYDLCFSCIMDGNHGHHPAHTFVFTTKEFDTVDVPGPELRHAVEPFCKPGRNVAHAALCDGCDKRVRGVRHKCLDCPDFDYCSDCIENAGRIHPGHRFAPIYTPIASAGFHDEIHSGIYCDGPLCKDTAGAYITGIRFKCAICHDTDFCANCEAHPDNTHNRTHPLLKFKSAVRHVSVCTVGENEKGQLMQRMGDRPSTTTSFTTPMPVPVSHAATQVQKPMDVDAPAPASPPLTSSVLKEDKEPSPGDLAIWGQLQARLVKETFPDETKIHPGTVFTQTFTLRNPGPTTWPEGCTVRFAGGDSMLNIDENHPTSTSNLHSAMESPMTTKPVPPCASAEFTLTLKAPSRFGRAISYWRLKTPDGVPFGDRMWCDLIVTSEKGLEPVNEFVNEPEKSDHESEAGPDDKEDVNPESKDEDSLAESEMVFPKLEKESPEASVIEGTPAKDSDESLQDIIEDMESITMDNDSDGFLTDEEYDILDASDQEFPAGLEKKEQK